MIVLGVSAHYHDSACAVAVDGEIVQAAQEERFTRMRFDPRLPIRAARACLSELGMTIGDVDCVAYYEKPALKLARQLWMGLPDLPAASRHTMLKFDGDRPRREIRELLGFSGDLRFVTHHEAHAASAFYHSGFAESALLVADAVGEWATTSYGVGDARGIELSEEVRFPHSLGILYSAVTSYLGFAVNSDEYKVMGLAPYGTPRYLDKLQDLVTSEDGGKFRLNLRYFALDGGGPMFTEALEGLLGREKRQPESELDEFHSDVAASVQALLESILLEKASYLHALTGSKFLSYAGGVALNCVANRRLREDGPFSDIFVQPAAGDAGGAAGAALLVSRRLGCAPPRRRLTDARIGPDEPMGELPEILARNGVAGRGFADDGSLAVFVAAKLAEGAVIGWFDGRMEFGPRALGARSILADPRAAAMRDHVNRLVKKREAFRPFAPAVVEERAAEFFEIDRPSPFMLDTVLVRDRAGLPAITHVDGTARVQTVSAGDSPRFHRLLTEFGALTGYPILLNTSFNMRGEPIVRTVADALACFVRAGLDLLVVGSYVLERADIPESWTRLVDAVAPYETPVIDPNVYSFL